MSAAAAEISFQGPFGGKYSSAEKKSFKNNQRPRISSPLMEISGEPSSSLRPDSPSINGASFSSHCLRPSTIPARRVIWSHLEAEGGSLKKRDQAMGAKVRNSMT